MLQIPVLRMVCIIDYSNIYEHRWLLQLTKDLVNAHLLTGKSTFHKYIFDMILIVKRTTAQKQFGPTCSSKVRVFVLSHCLKNDSREVRSSSSR